MEIGWLLWPAYFFKITIMDIRVHSYESLGTFDGPGLRLVVFLQGCNFRCLYCANPDTIDCKGESKVTDIEDIVRMAMNEKPFFGKRGGVTFSGGEPTFQANFSKYIADRNMKDYTTALMWSKVFLMGKSFTSFAGSEVAVALLFPMETVFESYVATLLRKELIPKGYSVSAQDRKYHLFDEPDKKFLMKPDIVITRKSDGCIFVMDTKWKVLSESKPNYGISQADMYQMYAYQKKYSSESVTLLYPKTENVHKDNIEFASDDGVTVRVRFVDLFDIKRLIERFEI